MLDGRLAVADAILFAHDSPPAAAGTNPARFKFGKALLRLRQLRRFAGHCLPAPHNPVAISRIDLDQASPPAGALRGDHDRADTGTGVEHNLATLRAVAQSI